MLTAPPVEAPELLAAPHCAPRTYTVAPWPGWCSVLLVVSAWQRTSNGRAEKVLHNKTYWSGKWAARKRASIARRAMYRKYLLPSNAPLICRASLGISSIPACFFGAF